MFTYLNLRSPPALSLPPTKQPPVTLTSETAFLLQTYVRTVATWMDLMDHSNTYQIYIPRLTLSSPLIFHSVCAFTAKYLSLSKSRQHYNTWEPISSSHYGESLRLLIHALNTPSYEHALTATILLSSYEIMSSIASDHHKRHLLGQVMLVKYHAINARSASLHRANFWVHVRHEIGFALTTERPMLMDPMEWHVNWEEGDVREDVQGNHILWILAKVLNLIYGPESETSVGTQKREAFLQELEDWRKRQLDSFIGIPYADEDEDGFRKVFFTVTAAAAGTFWYHVTHILLYTEPSLQNEAYRPFIQDQAKRIGDIAISEFPDSLRVFASHGLYYAAKHISGIARKARLWGIMNAVESELGYSTRPMVKRLQEQVERGG
ncbi:hypothetical protein CC80DRAFT_413477 [Byssothecium circinans]|uniref:Transcription factor domain-containing protein n=1 Tax=Byssothecium circinans TaxID=147558 RepID=A0A6A5TV06_9PLEO|nr:hypothetical protein CC80DRAFT_413477 [Byssothecium circinans]